MADPIATGVALPPKEAIAYLRQKAEVTSEHWTDLWQEAHTRAFTVAGATTAALVEDFRAEVARALEQGTSLAEFRARFDAIVAKHGWQHTGKPGWRAEIIYQTNLSMAYSAGRYRRMSDPDVVEVFPFWRYQHNYAAHPRPQHVAWDGLTLRHDDPWWGTHWPPNGWRCHCSVEPVSGRALAREKRGVDVAPAAETRPWRNPKTAEMLDVPKGIDPGFGYNPGAAWLDGEAGGRVGRGEPAERRSMPAADAPASTHITPADAIEAFVRRPVGQVEAGRIGDTLVDALGAQTDQVMLSEDSMGKQDYRHLDLSLEEYRQLPKLLASPLAVAQESPRKLRIIAQGAAGGRDGTGSRQLYRMSVKANGDGSALFLVSLHRTGRKRALRALQGLELVSGSIEAVEQAGEIGAPVGPAQNPT